MKPGVTLIWIASSSFKKDGWKYYSMRNIYMQQMSIFILLYTTITEYDRIITN